jgi:UDP-sugar transporter A1/2/3
MNKKYLLSSHRDIKGNMSSNKIPIRTMILVTLCLQNAGYTLIRKYSTITENVSSKEILLVAECIKLVLAVWFILNDEERSDAEGFGIQKLVWLIKNSSKMLILATIYGIMNILSFVALQYIGAGEFTICAQLKILTTAGFSVLVLGTSLSWTKWRALALLVLGCILVASPNFGGGRPAADIYLQFLGFGAVLLEVVLSGFASIYFERVVKSTTEVVTIWERNFQLAIYSIIMYGSIIVYESNQSSGKMSWNNWSLLTFFVAFFGAAGGLLVVNRIITTFVLYSISITSISSMFFYRLQH